MRFSIDDVMSEVCFAWDDGPDSKKNLRQKLLNGWRPGSDKLVKKSRKRASIMTSPQENPIPKTKKIFFQSQPENLPNP